MNVNANDVFYIGMVSVGFSPNQANMNKTNMARFMAHFGVHPETIVDLIQTLETTNIQAAKIPKFNVKYLLMTLNWIKSYDTYFTLASHWQMTEKTIGKWVNTYIKAIQALKVVKVSSVAILVTTMMPI